MFGRQDGGRDTRRFQHLHPLGTVQGCRVEKSGRCLAIAFVHKLLESIKPKMEEGNHLAVIPFQLSLTGHKAARFRSFLRHHADRGCRTNPCGEDESLQFHDFRYILNE